MTDQIRRAFADAGLVETPSPSQEAPIDDGVEVEPVPLSGASPLPAQPLKPVDLDFGQAMQRVVAGARVSRRSWTGKEVIFLRAGAVHIQNDKGTFTLTVQDADITATDWVALDH